MSTYLISYDLGKSRRAYDLYDAIKETAGQWWPYSDSTWIIKHPGPAKEIRDTLTPCLGVNDELLVVELAGDGAWTGFGDQASEWLKDNLTKRVEQQNHRIFQEV